ncbi:hypothetical protein HETIRDRAFT_471990 [Heterobasidion irregulare TC 32-1]|uniref:Uncharacterized protein n=1 Tax=Heterobasidion irregulare (strain TC 32-1) TaxID=747525 RepID=W4KF77_HETIT|nr:uncharacterized protein HETIRDRAFT_471990 [Heterobasidion irregulare TC 32-1]ETW83711.1 hypothetical protein HETIRDRAFT_471990 [Heterobasidion irregulare TC 32-1]
MAAPDEDDIDIETLQAQIDMSLAFAQDLVSSWIKPLKSSGYSKPNNSKDTEKELEELLRRPPRLGVGAPLPDSTHPSGRDAVKLKNKLAGKKRSHAADDDREPVSMKSKTQDMDEEDEEESRSGAIRKKVKIDPFATHTKKKGKAKAILAVQAKTDKELAQPRQRVDISSVSEANEPQEKEDVVMGVEDDAESMHMKQHEQKKRKKKRKKLHGGDEDILRVRPVDGTSAPPKPVSSANQSISSIITPIAPGLNDIVSSEFRPQYQTSPPKSDKAKPQTLSFKPHFVLPPSNSDAHPAVPVLNLSGPPLEPIGALGCHTSLKKKRKRKKKKRGIDGDGAIGGGSDGGDGADAS